MKVIAKEMFGDKVIKVYDNVIRVVATTNYLDFEYFDQNAQFKQEKLNLLLVNVKII